MSLLLYLIIQCKFENLSKSIKKPDSPKSGFLIFAIIAISIVNC